MISDGRHCDLHSFPTRRSSDLAPMILLGRISEVTVEPGRSLMTSSGRSRPVSVMICPCLRCPPRMPTSRRSEEHTSELQSQSNLVCRLLLEKKKLHDIGRIVVA